MTTDAKKFFADNITRFPNATTHPEQWNLYCGLFAMAEKQEQLLRRMEHQDYLLRVLQEEIAQLRAR